MLPRDGLTTALTGSLLTVNNGSAMIVQPQLLLGSDVHECVSAPLAAAHDRSSRRSPQLWTSQHHGLPAALGGGAAAVFLGVKAGRR